MSAADFVLGLGPFKFFILCLFSALTVIAVFLFASKILKELSVKVGNVNISLKNDKQKKDIVDLVFDYGLFQDQMNDTRDLAVECLHKNAKRYTTLQLDQYLQKLRSEYTKALEPSSSDSFHICNVIFNMFTNELKASMFGYLMDIYENNHLAAKSDQELKTMAHDHYGKLADMFRDHAAAIWIQVMPPYSKVSAVSQDIAQFVEGLVYDILVHYKGLSETRRTVFDASRKICEGVRMSVEKTLKMPDKAMFLSENFYTKANGFDEALVKEFLG